MMSTRGEKKYKKGISSNHCLAAIYFYEMWWTSHVAAGAAADNGNSQLQRRKWNWLGWWYYGRWWWWWLLCRKDDGCARLFLKNHVKLLVSCLVASSVTVYLHQENNKKTVSFFGHTENAHLKKRSNIFFQKKRENRGRKNWCFLVCRGHPSNVSSIFFFKVVRERSAFLDTYLCSVHVHTMTVHTFSITILRNVTTWIRDEIFLYCVLRSGKNRGRMEVSTFFRAEQREERSNRRKKWERESLERCPWYAQVFLVSASASNSSVLFFVSFFFSWASQCFTTRMEKIGRERSQRHIYMEGKSQGKAAFFSTFPTIFLFFFRWSGWSWICPLLEKNARRGKNVWMYVCSHVHLYTFNTRLMHSRQAGCLGGSRSVAGNSGKIWEGWKTKFLGRRNCMETSCRICSR